MRMVQVVSTEIAPVAFDFETTDPMWQGTFQAVRAKPIGVALAQQPGDAVYWPTTDISLLRPLLENTLIPKVAHNAAFEYIVARGCGIRCRNLHDTKLLAYVLRRPSTHLKELSWTELGVKQTRFEEVDWGDVGAVTQYASADADMTLRLWHKLSAEVQAAGLWPVYELERAVLPVVCEMTLRGIYLNPTPLSDLSRALRGDLEVVEAALIEFFGGAALAKEDVPNLNSDQQLGWLLYGPTKLRAIRGRKLSGRLQHCCPEESRKSCHALACAEGVRTGAQTTLRWFPPGLAWPVRVRTEGGAPAVDMDTLRLYTGEPVVGDLVRMKSIRQVLENNLTRLPQLVQEDGRIHPTFHQSGQWEEHHGPSKEAPMTGRFSSSGPNLQNITHHGDPARPYVAEWSKEIRRGFVAAPGLVLFRADVGQEEPRIGAFLAKDEALLRELEGGDVYCPVASRVFGREVTRVDMEERQIGKRCWMAWLNGAGPGGIQESAFWLGDRAALAIVKYLQERHPLIETYRAELVSHLHAHGYTATHFGRRIYRPEVHAGPGPARNHAERSVMPDAIQGTAADVMKLWLPRIAARLPHTSHLLLTIHDEIVGECPPEAVATVKLSVESALEGLLPIRLPCEFYVGPNWAEMVLTALV